MKINLKELREKAQRRDGSGRLKSVTRDELALMLEATLQRKIHVTQIARYEEDPSSVPIDILVAWLASLGTSIEELVLRPGTAQPGHRIDPGEPYAKLHSRALLLSDYLQLARSDPTFPALPENMPGLDDIEHLTKRIGRKPNIVFSGAFDVGKSTLANWLMSSNNPLPTQYQPTTAVVTYVRHISEKPAGLIEDVVLLRGIDPDEWLGKQKQTNEATDQTRSDYSEIRGNLETLRQYGTHMGDRHADTGMESSLVFIDSPLLNACNLIDFPGYQNDEKDSRRANLAIRHMDVLVYASAATGFMDSQDVTRLQYLLKALPGYERTNAGFPVLGNLFFIATHAGPQISDGQLFGEAQQEGLLDTATKRLWRELKDFDLGPRATETGKAITPETVRGRIFPFWRESARRTEGLEQAIMDLLSAQLPAVLHTEADRQVFEFKQSAGQRCSAAITAYESVLQDIEAAKNLFKQKQAAEPDRKRDAEDARQHFKVRIAELRKEHLRSFSESYASVVNTQTVEEKISERYADDKKEAQQFMAGYVLSELQSESARITKAKADEVSQLLERYVASYDAAAGILATTDSDTAPTIEIPFDARGAFIGGLGSVGTIGALSLWASSLGNLGGYIVAAKTVSILSGLGIATGGTASIMALVATIGGPVTLVIGLAAALFFGLKSLFGESWQLRLARQIVDHFAKEGAEQRFNTAIAAYWDKTLEAFEKGADAIEQEFVDELKKLEKIFENTETKAKATAEVERFRKAKDFFVGMPWIPMRPGLLSNS